MRRTRLSCAHSVLMTLAAAGGRISQTLEAMPASEIARLCTFARLDDATRQGTLSHMPWGWKEPRSMYYLPALEALYNRSMRFVLVVRDLRDIRDTHIEGTEAMRKALYVEQNATTVSSLVRLCTPFPDNADITFAMVYSEMHRQVLAFLQSHMANRFLIVRYESLTSYELHTRRNAVARLFDFVGVSPFKHKDALDRLLDQTRVRQRSACRAIRRSSCVRGFVARDTLEMLNYTVQEDGYA